MSTQPASCPLCGGPNRGPSWFGATSYASKTFEYVECGQCRSLFCDPMPDPPTLAQMYGPGYGGGQLEPWEDPRDVDRVMWWLDRRPRGAFLDFGCGDGFLLRHAQQRGWRAVGVEFDPAVAAKVTAETGATVVTSAQAVIENGGLVDVVNVGDVIEHLTSPLAAMRDVVACVRPGGLVLAQGPLEANDNLFTFALRVGKSVRARKPASMPPYHVLLATARGQRQFFSRLSLDELEFQLTEVDWPAPSRLAVTDLTQPRKTALFAVRSLSKSMTRVMPLDWGNRYFFAGKVPATVTA